MYKTGYEANTELSAASETGIRCGSLTSFQLLLNSLFVVLIFHENRRPNVRQNHERN